MAKRQVRLPEAGRPGKRDQTRAQEPPYQASKDAHIPIRAGQAEDLVGDSNQNFGSLREFHGEGVAKGPHVRPAVVLVPVQTQSEGSGRARSCLRWLWRAVSSGISSLRRLWTRPTRSGSSLVQAKAAKAARKLALSQPVRCVARTASRMDVERMDSAPAIDRERRRRLPCQIGGRRPQEKSIVSCENRPG